MSGSALYNVMSIIGTLLGAGGLQFILMHRYQRRKLIAQMEQSMAAAENSEVSSAQAIQNMALAMLRHKDAELTACDTARRELQRVITELVAYIQSVPDLPPMPVEIAAVIEGWS